MSKFLTVFNNKTRLATAIAVTTGATDADKIISTGADGKIDPTFLSESVILTFEGIADEALTAGDLVCVTGTGISRADATDATKPAIGYVSESYSSSATVTVNVAGINDDLSGLTPGTTLYLQTTSGTVGATTPNTTGNIIQEVGIALNSTSALISYMGYQVIE